MGQGGARQGQHRAGQGRYGGMGRGGAGPARGSQAWSRKPWGPLGGLGVMLAVSCECRHWGKMAFSESVKLSSG